MKTVKKLEPEFKVGDRVIVDRALLAKTDNKEWVEEATVALPVDRLGKIHGHGKTEETTHSVGIRFDNVKYGDGPGNFHTVANNRIRLAEPTPEEIEETIASIKEAARGH